MLDCIHCMVGGEYPLCQVYEYTVCLTVFTVWSGASAHTTRGGQMPLPGFLFVINAPPEEARQGQHMPLPGLAIMDNFIILLLFMRSPLKMLNSDGFVKKIQFRSIISIPKNI